MEEQNQVLLLQLQQVIDQKAELVRAQSHIRTLEEQYMTETCKM